MTALSWFKILENVVVLLWKDVWHSTRKHAALLMR